MTLWGWLLKHLLTIQAFTVVILLEYLVESGLSIVHLAFQTFTII
jgi:hypothetical protein